MNIKQLSEQIGLDNKTFSIFEGLDDDEPRNTVTVMYPNYLESVEFSITPKSILDTLREMEDMMLAHKKDVNRDLKCVRTAIKEMESAKTNS